MSEVTFFDLILQCYAAMQGIYYTLLDHEILMY